jgi:hypothetical protein
MIPYPVDYLLTAMGCLWLCIMLHHGWPRRSSVSHHNPTEPVPGFDHGVGHFLLLLYDAKTPYGQKANESNGLVHDLSNTSIGLLWIITKYSICITI